jgi:hypothetical protein
MKKLLGIVVLGLLWFGTANAANIVDELTKLNNLYKEGAITKEEFGKAKDMLFRSDSEKKIDQPNKIEKKNIKNKPNKVKNINQDLSKTFISLDEVDEIGVYKKLENYPKGLFKKTNMSSKALASKATQEMYKTFVQNKNLMEKYPENMMKAMGHFEVFYMQKLKEGEKYIEKFKKNYPNISWKTKKEVKSLHSLNQAKKSMRESIGLTLNDDPEEALERYMHMHNFLAKGEKTKQNLTKNEKKLKKRSAKFKKHYGSFKKTVQHKSENRIDKKTFEKDLNKNIKDVRKSLKNLTNIDPSSDKIYEIINEMFEKSLETINNCKGSCKREDLLAVIDSTDLTNTVLKDVEKDLIKKSYTQDLSNVNIENLEEKEKETLTLSSLSSKQQKAIKKNELKSSVLNLNNKNFPVAKYLDKFEEEGVEIKSITTSFDGIDNIKNWTAKDWANSWKGDLPTDEFKDKTGNLIKLSQQNIEDLKAQLALNDFSKMVDVPASEINDSLTEMAQVIKESGGFNLDTWLNQDFSITLDNYVRISVESQIANYGNSLSADAIKLIRDNANFENLTHLTNLEYGTNMTAQEYASYWEGAAVTDSTSNWGDITRGVDLLDQVGSFEAASIAKDLGTDLQTVADSIALAASVGVSADLEAVASGLGYSSFADAVAAYNKQYGTNYSVDEAKEALGQ